MQIQFDAHQDYQLDAVQAVVDVFEGQPPAGGGGLFAPLAAPAGQLFGALGLGNALALADEALIENARAVQRRHGLPEADTLSVTEAESDGAEGPLAVRFPNFTVEMETGTGKTYVYLRTLFALYRRYGWTKFVVVVPSVAIREGVLKTVAMTRAHFAALYDGTPLDAWTYDARGASRLRTFATASTPQLLVLNIDAFNKDANVMRQRLDRLSGHRPLDFLQAVRPVALLDEPQNLESELAKAAVASLNPLCTLRYSATHRARHTLLYRLDPVRAYDLGLVKKIEVASVVEGTDHNHPYLRLVGTKATARTVTARLALDVQGPKGVARKTVTAGAGADLHALSGGRDLYRGYLLDEVDAADAVAAFSNGLRLRVGEATGGRNDEVLRAQVAETVRTHLDRELKALGIAAEDPLGPGAGRVKVLSLFFLDRVADYAEGPDGAGKVRQWFREEYARQSADPKYAALALPPVERVHAGYFAQDRGRPKDSGEGRPTKADDEAFALIMREKERLLDPAEPVRFLFSHSALREGWDNPNVFQICVLREAHSPIARRQIVGRGLRLPVRADGARTRDPRLTTLTVVAGEAFTAFAAALQTELEQETGVRFGDGRIADARARLTPQLKEGWSLDPAFQALWEKIKPQTRYRVRFDTDRLVEEAAAAVGAMPGVHAPAISIQRARLDLADEGVTTALTGAREERGAYRADVPDVLGHLQRALEEEATPLTRITLARILRRSRRLGDVATNPQAFLDGALAAIRSTLRRLIVDGIEYERNGAAYEMRLFETHAPEGYTGRILPVRRGLYSHVESESEVERRFAEVLDGRRDVRLFVKLPRWFTVDTPLGTYNPDWAIVKEEDERLYLVRETKGATDPAKLRAGEAEKIRCGRKHFDTLGVDFAVVEDAREV